MIQPHLTVARLEDLLDPVPLPLHADQFGQWHLSPGVGQRVIDARLADRTDHHQPLLRPDPTVLLGPDSDGHRVDLQRPLLPGADSDALPPRFRLTRRPRVGPSERHLALAAAPPPTRGPSGPPPRAWGRPRCAPAAPAAAPGRAPWCCTARPECSVPDA